ncbi:CPBP family intramembrane glutamic endopeptidase [Nonomuraea gerenzanensis]|uniref:Abortive infection protein n=1 Tax=Nonomuraea gerenzanensis TaxID=93944 RepID=A0A1M4EQD1_9ACTN|nr:CPBP family intramembrane glutamic endopeptidase [Nonomuraea gerenzanensis]UBU12494.1 CPBP family intramembrane metalloprotease [Nonomuraea gerenzanensis]SBP01049.1 Abortive infection protein [Nonomuraea gerenzanensis]
MRLLKQLVAVAAVALAGSLAVGAVQDAPLLTLVLGLATAALAVFVYARVVRWSERREPAEVAGKGAAPAFGRGLLIGVAMFGAVILNIAFLGGYRIDGFGSWTGAAGLVGFMAAAAVTEELLFRGILFRIIEERTGTWLALALTAVLFGLSHLFNPHANLWGAIAIAIEAGGMLAAAYAATRTLWLPMGLHFGWNFAAAGIFSTEVSGSGAAQGLLNGVTSGPTLVTGGAFGPEASAYAVAFGLLLTVVFLWLARRRGNLVPMRRRTTATLAP